MRLYKLDIFKKKQMKLLQNTQHTVMKICQVINLVQSLVQIILILIVDSPSENNYITRVIQLIPS